METEIRHVKEFPGYKIGADGTIYSKWKTRLHPLSCRLNNCGYLVTGMDTPEKLHKLVAVHRVVALAFVPNPDGKPNIDHINGIKTDNRADNLRWVTQKENVRAYRDSKHGLKSKASNMPKTVIASELDGTSPVFFKSISSAAHWVISNTEQTGTCAKSAACVRAGLRAALLGRQRTAYGMLWRFATPSSVDVSVWQS